MSTDAARPITTPGPRSATTRGGADWWWTTSSPGALRDRRPPPSAGAATAGRGGGVLRRRGPYRSIRTARSALAMNTYSRASSPNFSTVSSAIGTSAPQELHDGVTELDAVAGGDRLLGGTHAIHPGSVSRAEVDDPPAVAPAHERRVLTGHGGLCDGDGAGRQPAERRPLARHGHDRAGVGAAGQPHRVAGARYVRDDLGAVEPF